MPPRGLQADTRQGVSDSLLKFQHGPPRNHQIVRASRREAPVTSLEFIFSFALPRDAGAGSGPEFFPGNSEGTSCRSRQSECRMLSTSIFGLAHLTQHSLILLLNFSFSLHLFQLCPPCFGSSLQHASGSCMTTLWIITRVMSEIKRAKRLSEALVHFVIPRASLCTEKKECQVYQFVPVTSILRHFVSILLTILQLIQVPP